LRGGFRQGPAVAHFARLIRLDGKTPVRTLQYAGNKTIKLNPPVLN
jgi:hypothetical protein